MRNLTPILVTVISTSIFCCCNKEEDYFTAQGYVIGFDPCKKGGPYIVPEDSIQGLLVELSGKNVDTLLTYNIPWTLFDIPKELFKDFQYNYYFPDQRAYKFKFSYRYAKPDEKQMQWSYFKTWIRAFCRKTNHNSFR
jgi:hypothetical protein